MRQISVLIDGTAIPRNLGGVGRYVEGIVGHLPGTTLADGTAIAVHLVVRPEHAAHFREVAPDAHVVVAPGRIRSVPLRFLWEQTGLPALARGLGVDLVHSPHYTFPLLGNGPSVVTLHDATFFSNPEWHSRIKRAFFTWWTRRALRRRGGRLGARRVTIVPSEATRAELVRAVPGIRAEIRVAHLGVDTGVFHVPDVAAREAVRNAAGLAPDEEWIAFLGTIEPRKNVAALVGAYDRVRASRPSTPTLLLAGARGWDRSALEALDARTPGDGVVEVGYLPIGVLAGFLGGARFAVYPSLGEGFGLPVVEAMASGACVLTSPRLSLPEVGGDAAVYAEPDIDALTTAMIALLDDPDTVQRHRDRAVERAGAFTWTNTARVHAAAYADALGRSKEAGA